MTDYKTPFLESLRPGDNVFVISPGSFSNRTTYRRGVVRRLTPTRAVVEIPSASAFRTATFLRRTGIEYAPIFRTRYIHNEPVGSSADGKPK